MKRALLVLWVGVACGDPTQSGHVDVEVLDTIEEHVTHTINPGDRTGRAPPLHARRRGSLFPSTRW